MTASTFKLIDVREVLVGFVILYAIYCLHWQLTVGANRRRMIKEHGCKPIKLHPGLNTFTEQFVGLKMFRQNISSFKRHKVLETELGRFRKYGNTFQMNLLTTKGYSSIEPENLKSMLATNFKDWNLPDQRKSAFVPLLGQGIFSTDGVAWQHSRDLLRPNFTRSQVGDLGTFEIHVSKLIDQIPRDGNTVDLQELFFRLTLDSATEFLFGESTNSLEPDNPKEANTKFAQAFNRSQEAVGQLARNGILAKFFNKAPHFAEDVKCVHDFVDRFVKRGLEIRKTYDLEKADEKKEGRYVFLNELVKQTNNPIQIRSELLNILLAGRDTTASLLSNVWFILARRPDIWKKLQEEVSQLGQELPSFTEIKDMKYLRWVLSESLRLHPVVPGNARMAIRDTVLPTGGGEDGKSPLFVPAKTMGTWNPYAMHRRKDFYGEDAEDFRPERWETLRPGWEYLPFNGGPRICIGQQFALTEASYTTIRLLQEFKRIESRDNGPWEEMITLTCAGLNGAKVGLWPE